MKVLVTGAGGYIGSVLVPILLQYGFHVRALDALMRGCYGLLPVWDHPSFDFVKGDICTGLSLEMAMTGIDVVVHLAALVGPVCDDYPEQAGQINVHGTRNVLEAAQCSGVKAFIFASTCSNYGMAGYKGLVSENCSLDPVSVYSITKVISEREVRMSAGDDFYPIVLRFATAFGLSPRMRLDLMLHEFVLAAYWCNTLALYNPEAYRPFCHVRDIAIAVSLLLSEVNLAACSGQVYNIGGFNVRKHELAEMVKKKIPELDIVIKETGPDKRDYRVDFSKFNKLVPEFEALYTPQAGVENLLKALKAPLFRFPYTETWRNA